MSTAAVIQARMGSSRLPGKVLKPLGGVPLLWHTIQRVKQVGEIDGVILAIPDLSEDDTVAALAHGENVSIFRGSEQDVLERYYLAAKHYGIDVIVRITGDCPFIDPMVTGETVRAFFEKGADFLSNTLERTFPKGTDTEVFSFSCLERAYFEAAAQEDREHVTRYIYRNPDRFKCEGIKREKDLSHIRICVDYQEDYLFAKALFYHLAGENIFFGIEEIERLLARYPWLKEINRDVENHNL